MTGERVRDLAHIGHAELLTPRPEESLRFFVDVLGMEEETREGQSVFLRGWGDYQRYSLKLTESKHAIAQGFFLYGLEPGGNRVEVTTGGYFVYDPDPEPTVWSEAERARGQAWGVETVKSFHTYGTPVIDEP